MSRAKGKVARIGDGKYSKYIMLENKDGFYFNTKYDPKCGVGDVVGITYTPKGETRGNITKVEILEDAGGPKGVQENARVSAGPGSVDRNASIIMQHSQEMALRYVTILLSAEAIKLPKASDREEFVSTLVDEAIVRFNEQATNPGKPTEVEVEAEEKPADESWDETPEKATDDDW